MNKNVQKSQANQEENLDTIQIKQEDIEKKQKERILQISENIKKAQKLKKPEFVMANCQNTLKIKNTSGNANLMKDETSLLKNVDTMEKNFEENKKVHVQNPHSMVFAEPKNRSPNDEEKKGGSSQKNVEVKNGNKQLNTSSKDSRAESYEVQLINLKEKMRQKRLKREILGKRGEISTNKNQIMLPENTQSSALRIPETQKIKGTLEFQKTPKILTREDIYNTQGNYIFELLSKNKILNNKEQKEVLMTYLVRFIEHDFVKNNRNKKAAFHFDESIICEYVFCLTHFCLTKLNRNIGNEENQRLSHRTCVRFEARRVFNQKIYQELINVLRNNYFFDFTELCQKGKNKMKKVKEKIFKLILNEIREIVYDGNKYPNLLERLIKNGYLSFRKDKKNVGKIQFCGFPMDVDQEEFLVDDNPEQLVLIQNDLENKAILRNLSKLPEEVLMENNLKRYDVAKIVDIFPEKKIGWDGRLDSKDILVEVQWDTHPEDKNSKIPFSYLTSDSECVKLLTDLLYEILAKIKVLHGIRKNHRNIKDLREKLFAVLAILPTQMAHLLSKKNCILYSDDVERLMENDIHFENQNEIIEEISKIDLNSIEDGVLLQALEKLKP